MPATAVRRVFDLSGQGLSLTGIAAVLGITPLEAYEAMRTGAEPNVSGAGSAGPVVANRMNLSGGPNLLNVPTGTTAINVSGTGGTTTIVGVQLDGVAPSDGYELTVRQGIQYKNEAEFNAKVAEMVYLQYGHAAAGACQLAWQPGLSADTLEKTNAYTGWRLTYLAAGKSWAVISER